MMSNDIASHYIFQYHEFYRRIISSLDWDPLPLGLMHAFKGIFRKTHLQSSMALPEYMTLTEIFPTTIFFRKNHARLYLKGGTKKYGKYKNIL